MRQFLRLLGSLPVAIIGLASGAPSPSSQHLLASVPAMATAPALPAVTGAVPTDATVPAAPTGLGARPLRIPLAHSLLIAPHGCPGVRERFDVLIHFHGAFATVEPQLLKSGIDAVYLVQNLGNGSGAYEDAYAGRGALDAQLESIRHALSVHCARPPRSVGRARMR